YKIFLNVPDAKYVPCAYVQMPNDASGVKTYLVTERYLIHKIITDPATSPSMPHEHSVVFKRAGESGEVAGKASSAMNGWLNFKMSLGYGKSGKSLGYLTFWKGDEPKLADFSLEINAVNYSLNNVSHTQISTCAMTFDLFWDASYSQAGFQDGAYRVNGYDNAS